MIFVEGLEQERAKNFSLRLMTDQDNAISGSTTGVQPWYEILDKIGFKGFKSYIQSSDLIQVSPAGHWLQTWSWVFYRRPCLSTFGIGRCSQPWCRKSGEPQDWDSWQLQSFIAISKLCSVKHPKKLKSLEVLNGEIRDLYGITYWENVSSGFVSFPSRQ